MMTAHQRGVVRGGGVHEGRGRGEGDQRDRRRPQEGLSPAVHDRAGGVAATDRPGSIGTTLVFSPEARPRRSAPWSRRREDRADAICVAVQRGLRAGRPPGTLAGVAIQFARARYISRSSGGSAVRSAAYNAREAIAAERTGELFSFRHRDAPEHHAVLLPEGAAERFAQSGVLWNAAEAAERRKDAQVAREIVLALPANAEISTEDRIALTRSFAAEHFVAQGLAVQLDVHAPHGAEEESERANWHAHLLITTRRIEGNGFAATKARDLDPGGAARRRAAAGSWTAPSGASCGASTRNASSASTGWRRGSIPRRRTRGSTSGRCGCAAPDRRSCRARRPSGRPTRRRPAIRRRCWPR